MKKVVALILALSLMIFAIGCQGSSTQTSDTSKTTKAVSKEPIKIGAVVSVTGPAAPLGEPEKNTLLLEEERINKEGGIDGRDIDIIIEDDQSNPTNAVTAVDKLIDKGCVVILGSTITPSTLAMKQKTDEAKIPHVSMAAGIAITEAPNEWIFRTAQSDATVVNKVIDYLKDELEIKKFAILHDANAFGQSGAAELQKLAPDADLKVTSVQAYKTEDTNMTSQLTKIRGTDPDVVVVWGTNPGPAVAAKNMKELNMDIPYIGSHGIANMSFIQLAGAAANGVVFPAGKILVPDSAEGDQSDVIKKFIDDYSAKYDASPNSFAGHAYDAINITVNALKKAGDDKEKLRGEIEKTKGFVGISGIFNYSADNHDGTKGSDLIMIEIKDGKWAQKI